MRHRTARPRRVRPGSGNGNSQAREATDLDSAVRSVRRQLDQAARCGELDPEARQALGELIATVARLLGESPQD